MTRIAAAAHTIILWAIILWVTPLIPARAQDAAASHPLDAHLADSYAEDLDGLLERRYIRVLTTFNRTNFFIARGKLRGFEYALLKEYQKTLNKHITRKEIQVVFEFIPVSRDRLIPDLVDGYGDIAAAGLTVTPERRKKVDFTTPYLTGIDEVLVTHKAVSPIQDVADLSGFDHRKVSPQGAVGIMQVRPGTAADPKIGIPDISSVENNIHAATKYMDFLRKHYFDETSIRPRDQVRFSLAAYNAGPVKIRQARRMVGDMYLDPNRWFRNVEMAVLKIVGQETVRYVSNINKYYVIYNNALERVEKREAAIDRVKK